jgi:hypothetical protein
MSSKASPAGGGFSPLKNEVGPFHHLKDLACKPSVQSPSMLPGIQPRCTIRTGVRGISAEDVVIDPIYLVDMTSCRALSAAADNRSLPFGKWEGAS